MLNFHNDADNLPAQKNPFHISKDMWLKHKVFLLHWIVSRIKQNYTHNPKMYI